MGYQENYVRIKDKRNFVRLIELIKEIGHEYYEEADTYPVEIITLKQAIQGDLEWMCKPDKEYKFDEGEKFIYFVGERYLQSNACRLLNNKCIEGVEIYFTECFPSDDIFQKEENNLAIHEKFIW